MKPHPLLPTARALLYSSLLIHSSAASASKYSHGQFIAKECPALFKKAGAGDDIIRLWHDSAPYMEKILSSPMVQGMENGTLTRNKFDELYMRPDIL